MKTTIYKIRDRQTNTTVPVRAPNMSRAMNYFSRGRFEITVADTEFLLQTRPEQVLDATNDAVHPDQQKLELEDTDTPQLSDAAIEALAERVANEAVEQLIGN